MAISSETRKRFALATALRGVVMLLAGLYAVFWPVDAMAVLVLFGGALLIIDGALGLWSLTFGGGKSGNYWFDVFANAASLLLGVLFFIQPALSTIITLSVFGVVVGMIAILVGLMQIVVVVRERESYARIWPVVLSGLGYIAIGLVFALFPVITWAFWTIVGGFSLILFSIGLFGWAWRLYQRSKA